MHKMHIFKSSCMCAKYHPGPSCSKLTMSLVDISLKLCIDAHIFAEKIRVAFAFAKANIFFSKNTCELDIVLTRTVNILTTNESLS